MVVVAVGVAPEALVAVEEGVLVEGVEEVVVALRLVEVVEGEGEVVDVVVVGVEVVEAQEDLVASNANLKSS